VLYAFAGPMPQLPNASQAVGYRIGRLIAAIGIPLLIAYLVAGRKKARKPNLFAGLFCGLCIGMVLMNAASSLGSGAFQIETTEQKTSRLMREAAGLQPVRKSFFGENKLETKLRGLFKEVIDLNKDYQQASNKIDISGTAVLGTSDSFANPDICPNYYILSPAVTRGSQGPLGHQR
ncbi:MAG TPA: hypothetical protein VE133_13545, partial [Candidatus Sulfotelmatobacter sp.]|nr:hypothetical protein [Candidatus Sulfotelmatobacter sp.]